MIEKSIIEKEVASAYEKYRPQLIKDIPIFLINKNLTEDCIQETFIIFQNKLIEKDGKLDNTYAYLKTVARNVAVNFNREGERYFTTDVLPDVSDGEFEEEQKRETVNESLEILGDILDDLTPRAKYAVIYHHALNHTINQTARIIGSSESATKKLLYRTIKNIRKSYEDMNGGRNVFK